MAKSLSTTTLSLRFMQNAQRKNQIKETQLEKAAIKDEGEWEISKDVRDSWASSSASTQSVSYEASYLPFLFASGSEAKLPVKGRRVFKKGHEVETTQPEASSSKPSVMEEPSTTNMPKTLSSQSKKSSAVTKSAKAGIFDNTGVGEDIRTSRSKPSELPPSSTTPTMFKKPAGVDEPQANLTSRKDTIVDGARAVVKSKRKSATALEGEGGTTPKPKKRKAVIS